jgi:hypothetical protein
VHGGWYWATLQSANLIIAAGDAVTAVAAIRKAAASGGNLCTISGPVFAAAKLHPPAQRYVEGFVAC